MQLLALRMWSGTRPDGETHTYHYGNHAEMPDAVGAQMLDLYPESFAEVVDLGTVSLPTDAPPTATADQLVRQAHGETDDHAALGTDPVTLTPVSGAPEPEVVVPEPAQRTHADGKRKKGK